jgi:tRNA-dihydrouridine synthase
MLGNGDVRSYDEAMQRVAAYGLDGVLIGRGSNGNPFVFQPEPLHERLAVDRYQMLRIALEHAQLHSKAISRGHPGRFLPMRKHLGWYVRGVPGASTLRRDLVETSNAAEVAAILDHYFAHRRAWEEHHPHHADARAALAPQHAPFA